MLQCARGEFEGTHVQVIADGVVISSPPATETNHHSTFSSSGENVWKVCYLSVYLQLVRQQFALSRLSIKLQGDLWGFGEV